MADGAGMAGRTGARVIVVDANAYIRRLVATLLGAIGVHDVAEARTPAAAVPLMLHAPPDLVILDWGVDPTDALLFVHRLRRGELSPATVPVLALANRSGPEVADLARRAGVDEIVVKPLSAMALIRHVSALLLPAAAAAPAIAAE